MEATNQNQKINLAYSNSTQQIPLNKNSFLVSSNLFNAYQQVSEIVEDIKNILDVVKKSKKSQTINSIAVEKQILQRKIGKMSKKYSKLFSKWAQLELADMKTQGKMQNNILDFPKNKDETDQAQSEYLSSESNYQYWLKPIHQTIHDLRAPSVKSSSIHKPQIIQINQSRQQEHSQESDESWSFQSEPKPINRNPHLKNLISFISRQLNLFVYLPSKLKITIIGVNQIDQANQRASIILKLQLQVKLPQNAQQDSQLFRHMSKVKIHAKSKKMKNQQENLISFINKQSEKDIDQSSSFYGNAHENDHDANYSIWTDFQRYYSLNQRFQDKNNQEIKRILKKLGQFQGMIFSAKLKDVQVKINSYAFHAPFQILDLNGYISIQEIQTKIDDWQDDMYQYLNFDLGLNPKINIKFNLVDVGVEGQNIQHIANAGPQIQIDDYQLAERLIRVEFNDRQQSNLHLKNQLKNWVWYQKPVENKQVHRQIYLGDSCAYFHFPFYRHPLKSVSVIFVPTFVLGIINMFIFFQEFYIADRIANISTLLISFIALINVIQFQIKNTAATMTSILVHLMTLTPLFTLLETMTVYLGNDSEQQPDSNPIASVYFWICIFINGINILYPVLMYTFYACAWKPSFNMLQIHQFDVVFPGDSTLIDLNLLFEHKNYYPIRALRAQKKIGEWEKYVSNYTKQILANSLESDKFQKKIKELSKIFPKFHRFLTGKEGQIYQNLLLFRKKSSMRSSGH